MAIQETFDSSLPRIELVERFAEPEFTCLAKSIFREHIRPGAAPSLASNQGETSSIVRLGAFHGDRLVGWTYGWLETASSFYMANSGVAPPYRRRGIYSQLVRRCIECASEAGAPVVRSRHVSTNNPVLVAKLKLGFLITGVEYTADHGALLHLSYFSDEDHRRRFIEKNGPAGGFVEHQGYGDG